MADPDVALMLAFKKGDDAAFEKLVERHSRALVNYFYFQCGDHDLAEDCAQEVWIRVFRARNDYVPRARFRSWLFRVARNLWIDTYRSMSRRPQETSLEGPAGGGKGEGGTGEADLSGVLPARSRPADAGLEEEELAAVLAGILRELPPQMREVYVLGEIQGLPYAEIAGILGIPVGTVKSRMFNAVRRIRERVAGRI